MKLIKATEILNAMNNKLLVGGIFLWFRESFWLY